jgi:hypothetical protein
VLVEFGPSSILYPLDVHGKPTNFFTVPAFFPHHVRAARCFSPHFRRSLRGKS